MLPYFTDACMLANGIKKIIYFRGMVYTVYKDHMHIRDPYDHCSIRGILTHQDISAE